MTGLEISFSSPPDALVAHVEGEVDLTNTRHLSETLLDALPGSAGSLVLDLSGVRYLDSAGIRMLFEVASRLETGRQRLVLVVPEASSIRRLLAITSMDSVAEIRASVDEAIERREATPNQPG